MPYIPKNSRLSALSTPSTAGELNFAITTVVNEYLQRKGLKYDTINDILGALEGSKLEFYRRIAVPYENVKLAENGDVYELEPKTEEVKEVKLLNNGQVRYRLKKAFPGSKISIYSSHLYKEGLSLITVDFVEYYARPFSLDDVEDVINDINHKRAHL